ncbi:DUF2314 domain-containing protein [Cytophagaceae bacterium ABcell3]|nr:DUF2314 domain-containing protein [Cytophagaceae bacterium ABcell3]
MGRVTGLLLFFSIIISGCGNSPMDDHSDVSHYNYDLGFVKAKHDASLSMLEFIAIFQQRQKDTSFFFSVKAEFTEGNLSEHMWVEVVNIKDKTIRGILGNQPQMLRKIQLGEQVKLHISEVEDWMIYDMKRDTVLGAHLIRAMGREHLLH